MFLDILWTTKEITDSSVMKVYMYRDFTIFKVSQECYQANQPLTSAWFNYK